LFVAEFRSARAKVDATLHVGEVGIILAGLMQAPMRKAHEGCLFMAVLDSADLGTQLLQSRIRALDGMQVATSLGHGTLPSAATAFWPGDVFFASTMPCRVAARGLTPARPAIG